MPDGNISPATDDLDKESFHNCSVLLFDPQTDTRYQAADALTAMGFRDIRDLRDMVGLQRECGKRRYDLLVGDTGGLDGTVCDLVRSVRRAALGRNPFVGIILTTWSPTAENVRRAVNSGTDHLLAKPFSRSQVDSRVRAIVDARRPFVVALDYVGPDRRSDPSRPSEIELIEVPNELRAKARGDYSAAATADTIEAALGRINRQQLCRHDLEVGVLVALFLGSMERGDAPSSQMARLKRLLFQIEELKRRAEGGDYGQAPSACVELAGIIRDLLCSGGRPPPDRLDLLERTAMALHMCCNPDKSAAAIAATIAEAAERIERRGYITAS